MLTSVNNSPNFKSVPIQRFRLPKLLNGRVIGKEEVVLSELDPFGNEDLDAIAKISDFWQGSKQYNNIKTSFCYMFGSGGNMTNFHAIELQNDAPLAQRIIGLMQSNGKTLWNLFVKPEVMHSQSDRQIKGVGETLLGDACALARDRGLDSLDFTSYDDDFYFHVLDKAQLSEHNIDYKTKGTENPSFTIFSGGINKFLAYLKEERGINFSTVA